MKLLPEESYEQADKVRWIMDYDPATWIYLIPEKRFSFIVINKKKLQSPTVNALLRRLGYAWDMMAYTASGDRLKSISIATPKNPHGRETGAYVETTEGMWMKHKLWRLESSHWVDASVQATYLLSKATKQYKTGA